MYNQKLKIMAKTSGGVRNSKWKGDIYTVDGVRKEYFELNEERKAVVRSISKDVAKEMWGNLSGRSVVFDADGKVINVQFTRKGVEHVARDAMLTLSGKYMSRSSMKHIDKILAKAEYVPTNHILYKSRSDGKTMFFRYKDKDGRGLYFKVAYNSKAGTKGKEYALYSVVEE